MRVLVTGACGALGAPVIHELQVAGHEVVGLDRQGRPRGAVWEHWPADLRDILALRRAVVGIDAVVHMGAIANDRVGAADDVLNVNVAGTWNLLLASAEVGIRRVVYLSSVNSLGNFGGHRPAADLPIDDFHERHPMTPYQLSKHLGEEVCRAFTDMHGMTTICLRPVMVANPAWYARWHEAGPTRRSSWGRGDYWAYVDGRDVAEAVRLSLEVEGQLHDACLLAANDTTSDQPTAQLIAEHYPDAPWPTASLAEYVAEDPFRSLVDCRHALRLLGWKATRTWRDHA